MKGIIFILSLILLDDPVGEFFRSELPLAGKSFRF